MKRAGTFRAALLALIGVSALAPAPALAQEVVVDRAEARVDNDVILLSEVRELGQFQELVEGKAEPELKRLNELIDQHIIEQEATTAGFKAPTKDEIEQAEKKLAQEAGGEAQFHEKEARVGLADEAVQRELNRALYYSRYIDYKFRPAAQIGDTAVEKYYNTDFAAEEKARGQAPPPLNDVKEQIREVLVQQDITNRANQWLEETRTHEKVDIMLQPQTNPAGTKN
jgi:hypothetical protein